METIYNNEDLNDYQESDVASTENNDYIPLFEDDGLFESEYKYNDDGNARESSYIQSPSIYNSQQMRTQLKTRENMSCT